MSTETLAATHCPVERAEKEKKHLHNVWPYQVGALFGLIPTTIILGITEWWSPDFFNFPYWQPTSWEKIAHFWPLLLYGSVATYFLSGELRSTKHDHDILKLDMITSTLAGLWEEFGFRYLYVCTAMLSIIFCDFLSAGFLALLGGGAVIGIAACSFFFGGEQKGIAGLFFSAVGIVLACVGLWVGWTIFWNVSPLSWLYDVLFVPVTNFLTFGHFEHIFYGKHDKLFVFGMVSANAAFRNGHVYQGPLGLLNSWFIGFVMIHATLTYGLWTAIAIHVLYDVAIGIVRFGMRKMNEC